MAYALGPVKPYVRKAAEHIGKGYGVSVIYGVASRAYTSDHPRGLALDFMVGGDKQKGDNIAAHVMQNMGAYNASYVIWYQHIYSVDRADEGWRKMEDRGSATANHMDHVHVSFNDAPVVAQAGFGIPTIPPIAPINPFNIPGNPLDPGDVSGLAGGAAAVLSPLADLSQAIGWLSDSHNLIRVGIILGGAALILFALIRFGVNAVPAPIRKAIKK